MAEQNELGQVQSGVPPVAQLAPALHESPLVRRGCAGFVDDATRIRWDVEVTDGVPSPALELSFEKAGPRPQIFFDPAQTTVALLTSGGLSPGLNNVIRSAQQELSENYGVRRVLGIRNGYSGLDPQTGQEPVELDKAFVEDIPYLGGSVLGTWRGALDPKLAADFLNEHEIDVLLCVGGDGTQRGAHAIAQELGRRGCNKAVVGVPKTIDNDIPFVDMSFGYATALERAAEIVRGAHVEARGVARGIAVVKVMGRDAGFIAAAASVVSHEADYVLVPEVPFPLEGEFGFLADLERRVADRDHAVVVVAEGAGQHHLEPAEVLRDASGNVLHGDIGPFLCERIREHFANRNLSAYLKYFDPGYVIRSVAANAWDCFLCDQMARDAVHCAMSGRTDVMIGMRHQVLIHVPLGSAAKAPPKRLDPSGELWTAVLAATGQPNW